MTPFRKEIVQEDFFAAVKKKSIIDIPTVDLI
jgi:hypothetical protein